MKSWIGIIFLLVVGVHLSYGLVDSHLINTHPVNTTNPNNRFINYSNIQNYTSYIILSKSDRIGIQESQVCINMLKHHMKSDCLGYDKLKQFDNTNPYFTGHFINDTWYHKIPGKLKNTWQFGLATNGNWTIQVDPDAGYTTQAKMIIVQSGNFTFINPDESIGKNHTRNEYYNRFVANCELATVAPNISLIKDTIIYLESNCTKSAYLTSNTTHSNAAPVRHITTGNTPVTRINPYSSLILNTYMKSLLHDHLGFGSNHTTGGLGPPNCIMYHCAYTDPYRKAGY